MSFKGEKIKISEGRYKDKREYRIPRNQALGGSEVDSVFNLRPYGCKRRLYYIKKDMPRDYPENDNFNMRRGRMFEDLAAALYSEQTKRKLRIPNRSFRSDRYPFMMANIDRLIIDKKRGSAPLEIKNPSKPMFFKTKQEGMSDGYLLQLQHYIEVKGADWGSFCVFCPDIADIIKFDVNRDDSLIQEIVKGEGDFWTMLQQNKIPEALEIDDKRCATCNWRITCHGDIGAFLENPSEFEYMPDLNELTATYMLLKKEVDERQEILDNMRKTIILTLDNKTKVRTDSVKIFFNAYEKSQWETQRLAKEHPEIAEQYKRKVQQRPLRIFGIREKG